MKSYILIPVLLVAVLITACESETQLQKSVYVHDAIFPDLPEYSEWGYNTFGAFYDRQAFVSNNNSTPVKVVVHNKVTSFIFQGYMTGNGSSILTLKILNFVSANYEGLIALDNTVLDLTKPGYEVTFALNNGNETETKILSGSFTFKRAQKLLVDTKQEEVILSGVFDFQVLINSIPVSVNNGRFDVGIGSANFFNY